MGSYCNVAGMTASLPCPAGSYGPYTNGQTSSCVICPQVCSLGNRRIVFGQSLDSLWLCYGLTLDAGLVLRSGQHGPHRLPGEHVQHRVRRPELDYMPVQLLLALWPA